MTNFNSLERLKKLYSAIGLKIRQHTFSISEIRAFSCGIELVYNALQDDFQKSVWANYNNSTMLSLERIMNLDSENLSDDDRKSLINKRIQRQFGGFSVDEFLNCLSFYSNDIVCKNNYEKFEFNFVPKNKSAIRKINQCINGYLPVFATSSFGESPLTFEQWDSMTLTVNDIDRMLFRFDNLETWGGLN